ncbi:MAG: hypothetical protein ACHP7O_09725 [Burkholderiales bacterium]
MLHFRYRPTAVHHSVGTYDGSWLLTVNTTPRPSAVRHQPDILTE